MKKEIGLLLTVLFLSLYVYGQEESNWITHADNGYSIEYPSNWILSINKKEGRQFSLRAPQATVTAGVSTAIIKLTLKKVAGARGTHPGFILEDYLEEIIRREKKWYKDAETTSERVEVSDGPAYQKVTSNFTKSGEEVYACVRYYLVNKSLYFLGFTCGQDSEKSIVATGEKILESFKLE